jgi:hypothetical protein
MQATFRMPHTGRYSVSHRARPFQDMRCDAHKIKSISIAAE